MGDAVHNAVKSCYLSASAGSGKTYALSMRFCQQVMLGVPPDQICALTFTRAATREIFAAIIKRFLDGDVQPIPGGRTADEALASILDALARLQISTIDAFTSTLARLFAYDLGLNPDFKLYGEDTRSPEGVEALREIVQIAFRTAAEESTEQRFKQLNVHHEDLPSAGALMDRLQTLIETFDEVAQTIPKGWGEVPITDAETFPLCEARAEVFKVLQMLPQRHPEFATSKAREAYETWLAWYNPEILSVRKLFKKEPYRGREHLKEMAEEGLFSANRAKLCLEPDEQEAAQALWDDLRRRDLDQTIAYTKALRQTLELLLEAAKSFRQETGKIGFSTLTRTLSERIGGKLSFIDPTMMKVAYRMDAMIRHLMIDEFQDTATTQWSVLSSLAHELAENPDHSFFYVGDVKQSIYGWRGGDATLFADTSQVPDIPAGDALVVSYRSSPTIIDFINQAMDLSADVALADSVWKEIAFEAWQRRWEAHKPHRTDKSYVAWHLLSSDREKVEIAADCIAERWMSLKSRNLTVAVLARKNAFFRGNEEKIGLLDALRARGIPCAIDGERSVADTTMGQLVLRLLHWMADPRATLWGEVAQRIGLIEKASPATVDGWMREVVEKGFVAWLEGTLGDQTPFGKRLTAYDLDVLHTLRQGLETLDAAQCVDPAQAEATLQRLTVPCKANESVITLMTVHRSKGLTFDVVFTFLDEPFGQYPFGKIHYEQGKDWLLVDPLLKQISASPKALMEAQDQHKAALTSETLCLTYVALTRAKREQIILSGATKKDVPVKNTNAELLYQHFDARPEPHPTVEGCKVAFTMGDADWWVTEPLRKEASTNPALPSPTPWTRVTQKQQVEVELPSESARAAEIKDLLAPNARRAVDRGIALHHIYASIEWTQSPPYGHFKEVFTRPQEPCILWRERPFSVRINTDDHFRYYAGQFDRVHLYPDAKRAVIYDFKTGFSAEVTPAYERQLRDYQSALAVLTGYPKEAIQMVLLFTRTGQAVEVK